MSFVSIAAERYRALFGPLPDPIELPPAPPLPATVTADHPDDDGPAPIRAPSSHSENTYGGLTRYADRYDARETCQPDNAKADLTATYQSLPAGEQRHLDRLAKLTAKHGPLAAAQRMFGGGQ